MSPQLTVHNAQISTATVEIKTLTLNGKQVTLATFRQLKEEELVAHDGTLNGLPWGTVNYHPAGDKCADTSGHLHVVWQKGTELRRSLVRTELRWPRHVSKELDLFYSTCVGAYLHADLGEHWFGGDPLVRDKYQIAHEWWGEIGGLPSTAFMSDAAHKACAAQRSAAFADQQAEADPESAYYRKRADDAGAAFSAAVIALDGEVGSSHPQVIEARYNAARNEAEAEIAQRKRHTDVRKALADLPQLFIAV